MRDDRMGKRFVLMRDGPSVEWVPSDEALRRHYVPSAEWLPHHVIELILEKLPLQAVRRFRFVSKKWKATIDSQGFKERQFVQLSKSRGPHVLWVCLDDAERVCSGDARMFEYGSSSGRTVWIGDMSNSMFCYGSVDGLLCFYNIYRESLLYNPATRWRRRFPHCTYQKLLIQAIERDEWDFPGPHLGLGRDKVTGTYKPVWLYNSSIFGLDNVTTCELFDFTTNSWRYVVPSSPYPINAFHKPVYLDGLLYWFTEGEEPKLLSFDLHTETFQVVCKAPFARPCDPSQLTMCILDHCLCVSEKKWPTQVIWSFDSSHKTWNIMCSLDLIQTLPWFGEPEFALSPVAIIDKYVLFLQGRSSSDALVIHNLLTKTYLLLFVPTRPVASLCYYESLLSALSN